MAVVQFLVYPMGGLVTVAAISWWLTSTMRTRYRLGFSAEASGILYSSLATHNRFVNKSLMAAFQGYQGTLPEIWCGAYLLKQLHMAGAIRMA